MTDYQNGATIGLLGEPGSEASTSHSSDSASGDGIKPVVGQAVVDVVNPRLSRYGIKTACRLASLILVCQVIVFLVVLWYYRRRVTVDSKLVDYSTALRIGIDSDTEGLCGTYTVMAAVLESEVKLSRSITLGRVSANSCTEMAIGSEFAISQKEAKHLPYMWGPLVHDSICGDARDIQEYVDTCNRISMAVNHMQLNISHIDTPIAAEHIVEVDISSKVSGTDKYCDGVVKDGAIYFAPSSGKNVGIFNTTSMSFITVDLPVLGLRQQMYDAAVLKDDVIYLVPYNAGGLGIFNITARTFDQKVHPRFLGKQKYSEGVLKDDVIYLVPDKSDYIGIYNITSHHFRTIDISSVGKGRRKYSGGVMKGDMIYFVPFCTRKLGIFDTRSLFFSTVDITAALRGGRMNWLYRAGVLKDDAIYFAPQDRSDVGIFNITTGTFRVLSLPKRASHGIQKFSDCVVDGDTVYFVPRQGTSLCKLNVTSEEFHCLEAGSRNEGAKYRAGVVTDGALYLVPEDHFAVGKLLLNAVEARWDNGSRQQLRFLREKAEVDGRTAPCVLFTRTCSDYTCFNKEAVACSDVTHCRGPTVNVKQVNRLSWFRALLEAAALGTYYEMGATAFLLTVYFAYLRFRAKPSSDPHATAISLKDFTNVVMEGDSVAERERQHRGE